MVTGGPPCQFPATVIERGSGGAEARRRALREVEIRRLNETAAEPRLLRLYAAMTGDIGELERAPTWAELIAARFAFRAATRGAATREIAELRGKREGGRRELDSHVPWRLSLDGLPRRTAVACGIWRAGEESETRCADF